MGHDSGESAGGRESPIPRDVVDPNAPTSVLGSGQGRSSSAAAPCIDDAELLAFVEDELPPPRRAMLLEHADTCAACRSVLAHLAATEDAPPVELGRYRLEHQLGSGGMGVVWRAWDPLFERAVAIKLVRPELGDDVGRARALREARALARLQHPNVIAAYDVGIVGEEVFLATELIEGETLDRWQRAQPPAAILTAYLHAARGLAAAHALGLVHRDVKPQNILVGKDGSVKVGDFGLAITSTAESTSPAAPSPHVASPTLAGRAEAAAGTAPRSLPKLTREGHVPGTPAYMAPEQKLTSSVDPRADQFSLSLALAEALLGEAPPPGASPAALTALAAAKDPALAALPWRIIARGMAPRPDERFADLGAWIEAIEKANRKAGTRAQDGGSDAASTFSFAAAGRARRLAPIALIAAITALAAALAAARLVRDPDKAPPSATPASPPAPTPAPLPEGDPVELGDGARMIIPPGFRYRPERGDYARADGASFSVARLRSPAPRDPSAASAGPPSPLLTVVAGSPGATRVRFTAAAPRSSLRLEVSLEMPAAAGEAAARALAQELADRRLFLERPAGTPITLPHGGSFLLPAGYGYAREAEGIAIWGPAGGEFYAIQTYDGFSAESFPALLTEFATTQSRVLESSELIGPGQLRARFHAKDEALRETLFTSPGRDYVYVLFAMIDPSKAADPRVLRTISELTARTQHAPAP